MTTETPRTDAASFFADDALQSSEQHCRGAEVVDADFARSMERDLRECVELLERLEEPQELNPSNYDHEQVCELNAKMVELCLASRALLARLKETL